MVPTAGSGLGAAVGPAPKSTVKHAVKTLPSWKVGCGVKLEHAISLPYREIKGKRALRGEVPVEEGRGGGMAGGMGEGRKGG